MNTDTNRLDLRLQPRSIFSVPDAAGVQIACHEGSLWITLDNDPRDIVLNAGESFVGSEHRRALIYALDTSSLALTDAAHAAARKETPARRLQPRGPVFEQVLG
ncbi:MAG TPA: DUF2917 domain-containing protein [Burkholderiaceae bacterium]|nr:DUF2917 domain-containing protein [Burkholderiaceae bacterium]